MILRKHRTQFELEMTGKELTTLVEILQSYQSVVQNLDIGDEVYHVTNSLRTFLNELTYFKRYAEAEHKYLAEEEAKADKKLD